MSNLLQFIAPSQENYIEIGVITESLGNNWYSVKIGSRTITMQSAIDREISTGIQVIINRNKNNRYIIGTTRNLQSYTGREIIIDG